MTLLASRLRQLENPDLSVNSRAELCCEIAREFENKGEYEDARKTLSGYWDQIGQHPEVAEFDPRVAGEVILRAGVLTGFIGSKNKLADAQEKAKDLIFESLSIFQSLGPQEKIAEAQTELALCYWRTGENNEARDLLEEALSRLTVDSELKAKTLLRLAIVEHVAAESEKALSILTEHASLFQKLENQTLRGSYHVTLGNVLKKLWETEKRTEYLDRALVEYTAASYHLELAEHRTYLANVENNLGLVYFLIDRCEEAQQHLDHARRLLDNLKDVTGVAQVDESRARVLLKQDRVVEAERIVRSAVDTQEKSGRHALLAEALITHGRALARLGNHNAALTAFRRAVDLSDHTGNRNRAAEAAFAMFQEIGQYLAVLEGEQLVTGLTLNEELNLFEHDTIKLALENAKGSVTRAARSLGLSHQALSYILESRHKDLLKFMKPPRRRTRIKRHKD